MANQYQSIDPTLVAINAAKKVTPQAKKPVPASLTTQAPIQPSLNFQTQQPQAISTNITPPVAKIGGISSPFGAPNINSTPVLWWATPQEIGTRATELQSLPKQIPASWTTPKQTTVYGELFDDIKLNNLTEQEMAQYYPEIPESIRGSLFDDIKLNWLDEWELPSLYPELQGWQQTPLQWWVKWWASREWFNLWAREWINPVGKVFEEIDKQLQRIPNVSQEQVKWFLNDKLWWFGADFSMLPTMAVNTPWSLLKTAWAIWRWATNPLDTITWLYNLVTSKEWRQALWDRYGSIEGLQKTISEDPVWVASDILTIVQWWAWLAWKWAKLAGLPKAATKLWQISDIAWWASNLWMDFIPQGLNNLASKPWVVWKVATVLNAPVSPLQTAGKIYNNIPQAKPWEVSFADKAVWVYNGLDPETVRVMRDSPDIIKQLDEWIITKESMKNDLVAAVEQIKQQKKDVWGIYQKVYSNPTTRSAADIITKIENWLREQGVKIENGKIVWFDTTKMAWLTDQSKSALRSKFEDVMWTLRDKDIINVEDYHNIRKDIYGTSYQDWFITKKAPWVSKLSDILNEDLKQIPWFKEIDSWFKEASDLLDEIKSNVLNKEWDFKWTLKALLWEKWQNRLAVLDKHFPWFKEKLKGLAAYDDYLNTRTRKKVGLYEKAWAAWAWAIAWFMTFWPVGAVIWWLATTILKDFITDPKRFKDYIVSKAWKNLASKIELWTPLNIAEKTQFEDIINEVQKQPDLILPYKPTEVSPQGKVQQTPTPPKPTPKTPPITVEKWAIGMWTPKPKVTPVIPPKATVAPSVPAPKVDTFAKMIELDSNPLYKKQSFKETNYWRNAKWLETEYWTVEKVNVNNRYDPTSYTINWKDYSTSEVKDFWKKQTSDELAAVKVNRINSDAATELRSIEKSPTTKTYWSNLKWILDELWIKDVNSIPEWTESDILQMVRARKPVAPKKWMPKLWKEIMEQNISQWDDLISEAKKYKSADEFINKQDIVYHWTNNEFDNFQLSTNKTKNASSVNSKAVFFADDKNSVKYYGKNIKWAVIDKSNLFDYKNPNHIKELEKYLEKYSVQDVQPWALFGKDSLMSFLKKWDYWLIESKLIQSYIKKKWFDWFIANDYWSKDVYWILNLDKIKTESQLKQIREQANKKTLPPLPKKWK